MRGAGQNCEPVDGHTGAVPAAVALPATEKLEKRRRLRGRNAVGIAYDEHGGHRERRYFLGPVIIPVQHLSHLVAQHGEMLRVRRDRDIGLVHRRLDHERRRRSAHLLHSRDRVGVPGGPLVGRRDDYELPDDGGALDRGAKGDRTAHRVAHDVSSFKPQVLDQGRDILSHQLQAQWAVAISGAAVSLKIDGDNLTASREQRQDVGEHAGQAKAAMQQQERLAAAMDFVVQVKTVHRGVGALAALGRRVVAIDRARGHRLISL